MSTTAAETGLVEGRLLAQCTMMEDGSSAMDWVIETNGRTYSLEGIDDFLNERQNEIIGTGKHNISIPNATIDSRFYKVTVEASEVDNITIST
mmetsp:Transcript_26323/g.38889  ORF Transcript_26323/g.38889 Transcript_26323/m.38889 type:complete len:93 (+) Transcript_26323:143-421(+)